MFTGSGPTTTAWEPTGLADETLEDFVEVSFVPIGPRSVCRAHATGPASNTVGLSVRPLVPCRIIVT